MTHPFAGTPQYEQQYGPAGVGSPGNGLGLVGGFHPISDLRLDHRGCPNTTAPPQTADAYFADSAETHLALGEMAPTYNGPTINELQDAFDALTSRQQFVLSRRLGLAGDRIQYTQAEVAEAMGVTVREVKLLEARARRSLRANVAGLDERLLAA